MLLLGKDGLFVVGIPNGWAHLDQTAVDMGETEGCLAKLLQGGPLIAGLGGPCTCGGRGACRGRLRQTLR